jgi:glycosyltransferase involved in cell wall biosynthesis
MFNIVISSYNKSRSLEAVLKNLDNVFESAGNIFFEVIVVVDGSKDNTMQMLKSISVKYPLRYFLIPNSGLSAARNYGIEQCDQEYIIFCDDDVLFHSGYLPALSDAIEAFPDAVHIGNLFNIDKRSTDGIHKALIENHYVDYDEITDHFQYHVFFDAAKKLFQYQDRYNDFEPAVWWAVVSGGNLCAPKKYFDSFGKFDSSIRGWGPEDADLCYRFFKKGISARFNENCFLYHLDHHRNNASLLESMIHYAVYFIKKYKKPRELFDYLNFINGNLSLVDFNNRVCDLYGIKKLDMPDFSMSMKDYSGQEQIL